jgi:NAD(P)-dependent dehydrogenase (short-subunit alcohol dehydrogenase family)
MGKLSGLTCVVTGAAGGMGRELAAQLYADGCSLAIADVRFAELEETRRLCHAGNSASTRTISTHVCDVTDEDGVERFKDEVLTAHDGRVDVLINNAGIAANGSFLTMPKAKFDKVFDVSFKGVVLCTRAFLPHIIKAERGYIANLSSINAFWSALGPATGKFSVAPHAAYCAVSV